MAVNVKENGFETLIVNWLTQQNGYEQGTNADYNREFAVDETRLFRFLQDTQPQAVKELHILDSSLEKQKFFQQLNKKLKSDGVIKLLRNGFKYKHKTLDLFFVRPSVENPKSAKLYAKNIFSVTRQLEYSRTNPRLALDLCIFLNGLPVITMELKKPSGAQ